MIALVTVAEASGVGNMATPVEQRAQDIVTEAKRRLAASGGKASQLEAMTRKVAAEFDRDDQADDQFRDRDPSFKQPNDIEKYIDDILGMAGMSGAKNVPIPGERPTTDIANGVTAGDGTDVASALPAGANAPIPGDKPDGEGSAGDGWSTMQILGALGAAGAAGYGGKRLLDYMSANRDNPTPSADMPEGEVAQTGDRTQSLSPEQRIAQANGEDPAQITQTRAIADQRTPTDEMIDETMGGQPLNDGAQSVENVDPRQKYADAFTNANSAGEAIRNLKQAGVQVSPEQANIIARDFNGLKARVSEMAGKAVRGAVRGAM